MADGIGKIVIATSAATALVAAPVAVVVNEPAAQVAGELIQKWEGTVTVPYRDIVKKWTVCTGETRVEMRPYTLAECRVFLRTAIKSDFGMGVLRCAPSLQNTVYQLGAAISVAYNIGASGFCSSTMAKQFQAGDWYLACNAFALWNKAGKVVVTGLKNRRNDEMRACFTNLPPERTLTPKVAT